jgi:hypothetical protein
LAAWSTPPHPTATAVASAINARNSGPEGETREQNGKFDDAIDDKPKRSRF